jgi:DNA-binding transcriptional ArsR family regulator
VRAGRRAGMSETGDGEQFADALDPADAFAALADGTRVAILQALWEADGQTATFSELREAVGVDDSGQFNYHLDKLAGHFLRKTDDGYELALAGRRVIGSLLEGAYTKRGSIDPIALDRPCSYCGGDRTFRYEDERVTIDCADCSLAASFEVPPGVFAGHDRGEFPVVARRYLRVMLYEAASGFCPFCEGRFEVAVDPEGVAADDYEYDFPTARYTCTRCGEELVTDLGTALLFEPTVVGFYADHGLDIREGPLNRFIVTDDVEVLADDPPEVAVTYTADGEQLRLVAGPDLTVRDTERG